MAYNPDGVSLAPSYMVDVTRAPYNAVGDDSTDNTAAIQAALDANPRGTIFIPRSNGVGIYRCSGSIYLTTAFGRDFQGAIVSDGATIRWTTPGGASDTDANMSKGLVAYPRTNGPGGDTSGFNGEYGLATIEWINFIGPENGAAVYLANSINFIVGRVKCATNRYGIVNESTINARYENITVKDSKNAGIGFIASNNPNVYYGVVGYPEGMYNDGYSIDGITCTGDVVGSAAAIIDYGSFSERNRSIKNLSVQGNNLRTGVQYGYLGRGVLPGFKNIWGENIRTLVRIISSNANEGGGATTIAGITAAQPSGTMRVDSMPDTHSFGATIDIAYTHNTDIAFQPDCNGVVFVRDILTDATATADVRLTQDGKTFINGGIATTTGSPPIIQNVYGGYIDLAKLAAYSSPTTSSTVGAAGGASALPATPSGYMIVDINGTDRKIPYYDV